jgi:hypothetical protein
MKQVIPEIALNQHIAVLGKTGAGKSSTAKLIVEQVVADGARVCVLDPIKSDWWGLTLDANGHDRGLPFQILGGPKGHIPLHATAGKVVAEVVASGALPLSIIDMADFAPGGQAQFFTDFAPVLLRKMRGVLYLVMEEAHLFAPKERSGIGKENMAIHWAKTLAQAGRSKGVRVIMLTQRTQALHNAMLGSCDTLIAHRLTSPADQDPVKKWLKANAPKDAYEKVSESLSKLKTGDGWLCSGEAQIFEKRHFPRITTYDNTATPTDDAHREVTVPPVDVDALKALIGEAAKEAEASDPKRLREEVAKLRAELAKRTAPIITPPMPLPKPLPVPAPQRKEEAVTREEADALRRQNELLQREIVGFQQQLVNRTAPKDWPATGFPPVPKGASGDEEALYQRFKARLLSEVPMGGAVYTVTPPEKLRKDFQEQEVTRLLAEIENWTPLWRSVLKYLVGVGKRSSVNEASKRMGRSRNGEFSAAFKGLADAGYVSSTTNGFAEQVRDKIVADLSAYQPTEDEVEAVYQTVLHQIATDRRAAPAAGTGAGEGETGCDSEKA